MEQQEEEISITTDIGDCMTDKCYFVKSGEFIKIGHSTNVKERIHTFSIGNPHPLEHLLSFDGGSNTEIHFHNFFEKYRVKGEWFRYDGELKHFIEGMRIAPADWHFDFQQRKWIGPNNKQVEPFLTTTEKKEKYSYPPEWKSEDYFSQRNSHFYYQGDAENGYQPDGNCDS